MHLTSSGHESSRVMAADDVGSPPLVMPATEPAGERSANPELPTAEVVYTFSPVRQRKGGRENLLYSLKVRQQPRQARMVGCGEKQDRRPIDPPPIVQLTITDSSSESPIDPSLNPHLFCVCVLTKDDLPGEELYLLSGTKKPYLVGSTISSSYNLRDPEAPGPASSGSFFVFGDIGCRLEGVYRLKMVMYEVVENHVFLCASVISDKFCVYSSKTFPGMSESTNLSRSFADQGLRIRVRVKPAQKTTKRRRLPSGGAAHDWRAMQELSPHLASQEFPDALQLASEYPKAKRPRIPYCSPEPSNVPLGSPEAFPDFAVSAPPSSGAPDLGLSASWSTPPPPDFYPPPPPERQQGRPSRILPSLSSMLSGPPRPKAHSNYAHPDHAFGQDSSPALYNQPMGFPRILGGPMANVEQTPRGMPIDRRDTTGELSKASFTSAARMQSPHKEPSMGSYDLPPISQSFDQRTFQPSGVTATWEGQRLYPQRGQNAGQLDAIDSSGRGRM